MSDNIAKMVFIAFSATAHCTKFMEYKSSGILKL